jgi:hypothetical protein
LGNPKGLSKRGLGLTHQVAIPNGSHLIIRESAGSRLDTPSPPIPAINATRIANYFTYYALGRPVTSANTGLSFTRFVASDHVVNDSLPKPCIGMFVARHRPRRLTATLGLSIRYVVDVGPKKQV